MARAECVFRLPARNPPGSSLARIYVSESEVRVAGVGRCWDRVGDLFGVKPASGALVLGLFVADLGQLSASVRQHPPLCLAVVTQLVTRQVRVPGDLTKLNLSRAYARKSDLRFVAEIPRDWCLLGAAWSAGERLCSVGRSRVGLGVAGRLGEFFGKAPVVQAGGVKVGFYPFGACLEGVAGFFQCGDACAGGGGELVECFAMVSADAGCLVGCGGLGVVGVLDGGDLGLVRLLGVVLGLPGAGGGIGDLAGGFVAGGADVSLRAIAGLLDVGCGAFPLPRSGT